MTDRVIDVVIAIIVAVCSFFGGSGIGIWFVRTYIRKEAREEIKDDILELKSDIEQIKENYVQCKFCENQHNALFKFFDSFDRKLDMLLSRGQE